MWPPSITVPLNCFFSTRRITPARSTCGASAASLPSYSTEKFFSRPLKVLTILSFAFRCLVYHPKRCRLLWASRNTCSTWRTRSHSSRRDLSGSLYLQLLRLPSIWSPSFLHLILTIVSVPRRLSFIHSLSRWTLSRTQLSSVQNLWATLTSSLNSIRLTNQFWRSFSWTRSFSQMTQRLINITKHLKSSILKVFLRSCMNGWNNNKQRHKLIQMPSRSSKFKFKLPSKNRKCPIKLLKVQAHPCKFHRQIELTRLKFWTQRP